MPLWDEMEQCFASPEIQQRVSDLQEESAIELSNQSKERALVGEQHHAEAVDAQTHAAGGRPAVLQRRQKILVEFLLFAAGLVL